jgi:heptosyltransferase II
MSLLGNTANRILVVAPSWIGDAVLSHPLLERLTRRAPAPLIDVLAPGWVLPVYRRMPEVADTIENPFRHGQLALGARYRLGRKLARRGYTHAYVLPNSLTSALVPWFAGIPSRTGYQGEMRYGLLTDRRHLDKQALPLMVDRFAWLAQPADTALGRPLTRPRLRVDAAQVAETLQRHDLPVRARVACFCPGAEFGPAKRWPAGHFASLAQQLMDRGFSVWLLGSATDKPVGDEIVRTSSGAVQNLCGNTSLDDAINLLSAAELVITNDSGLMHVAAALDRPTVAIYGSSSPAFTPPLSDLARVVKLDLPCSPCFARTCPLKHFDCMLKLGPEKVMETIKAVGVDL